MGTLDGRPGLPALTTGRALGFWRRGRGWPALALVLGFAAVAVALAVSARTPRPPPRALTLSAGALTTTRAVMARELVAAAAHRGLEIRLVEFSSSTEEIITASQEPRSAIFSSIAARIRGQSSALWSLRRNA